MAECYEHEKLRRMGSDCPYCEITRLKALIECSGCGSPDPEVHASECPALKDEDSDICTYCDGPRNKCDPYRCRE